MTTLYPFTPSANSVFQFQPTLDGETYNVTVTWNVTGQRWYVNIFDLSNNWIITKALIGSPAAVAIESAAWANGYVTMVTAAPHGYPVYGTANVTISGCAPDAYNGTVQIFVVDQETFQFPLAADPGGATALGAVVYNVNLAGTVFQTSTLVFREASQTFEVSP